jgi:predicted DNA-binding mobile mystery protein A
VGDTGHEQRRRLDVRLARLRPWVDRRPPHGWIRTIRTALGMSGAELGARIGVSQSRVSQIERGEVDATLSLSGLERAAQGLDCDLVYALVPRTGLQRAVRVQALAKALQATQDSAEPRALEAPPSRDELADPEQAAAVERVRRHPAAAGKRHSPVPDPDSDRVPGAIASTTDAVQALADALIDRPGLWSDRPAPNTSSPSSTTIEPGSVPAAGLDRDRPRTDAHHHGRGRIPEQPTGADGRGP